MAPYRMRYTESAGKAEDLVEGKCQEVWGCFMGSAFRAPMFSLDQGAIALASFWVFLREGWLEVLVGRDKALFPS